MALIVGTFCLSGCAWLPSSGPTRKDVLEMATVDGKPRFELIDVDADVIAALRAEPKPSFRTIFGDDGRPPALKVAVGDTVDVSIWEGAGGTLFNSDATSSDTTGGSGAHTVVLPEQTITSDGGLSIPFGGRVHAADRTTVEIQREIESALGGKAVDPQAIVTVHQSTANSVTVGGEVVSGARQPISEYGETLLDLISASGGAKTADYETSVRLSRRGRTAVVPLYALIQDPSENIFAWPGDVLTLGRKPETFDAFGAAGKDSEVTFDAAELSLSGALAKSAGLLDSRADPAGVFLFRPEPEELVGKLRPGPVLTAKDGVAPVVYHLDMLDPKAFFLAQQFPMRDKDIVYVANSSSDNLRKFFQLVGTLTSPVQTGAVINNNF